MNTQKINLNNPCKVCYEQIVDNFYLTVECCKSRFHHACLQECLNAQVNNFKSATKCPNFDCGKDISDNDVQLEDLQRSQLRQYNQSYQQVQSNQNQSYQQARSNQNIVYRQFIPKNNIQNCNICLEIMDSNTLYALGCKDKYHKTCLEEYFKVEISQKKLPIKCPNNSCQYQIQPNEIKQILQEQDQYDKYEQFQFQNYIDYSKSQIYQRCFTPNCEYVFINDLKLNQFSCPRCQEHYCLECKCKYHANQTCSEYQISTNNKKLDQLFDEYVTNEKFRQCSKCQMYVEKTEGCDHMTCRCKYEFCYKCGGPYNQCECSKHVERVNSAQTRYPQFRNTNRQQYQTQQRQQLIVHNPTRSQQENNFSINQPYTNTYRPQQIQLNQNQPLSQNQNQFQSNQLNQYSNQRIIQSENINPIQQQILDDSQGNKINPLCIFDLGSSLHLCSNLSRLTLWISGNNIGIEGPIQLSRLLKKLENLEFVMIWMRENQIGYLGANGLLSELVNCKNLRNFTILLSGNKISGYEKFYLGAVFDKFTFLTNLTIKFINIGISDLEASNFFTGLRECTKLQYLSLFIDNNQISLQGSLSLANTLQSFKNLNSLQLSLRYNKIDFRQIIMIGSALRKSQNLMNLFLRINIDLSMIQMLKKSIFKSKRMVKFQLMRF
ncbi:hypothetical protein ABPG74_016075 [Tetrahymena malaccensis]